MRAARKAASGCIVLGVMVAVAMFSHAGASEYPNRTIRVVVPFAAAGVGADWKTHYVCACEVPRTIGLTTER